jgi:hypothetical protein
MQCLFRIVARRRGTLDVKRPRKGPEWQSLPIRPGAINRAADRVETIRQFLWDAGNNPQGLNNLARFFNRKAMIPIPRMRKGGP